MNKSKLKFISNIFDGALSDENATECDVLFVGTAVDDRGAAALSLLRNKTRKVIELAFSDQKIMVDSEQSSVARLAVLLKNLKRVRFEATTLGMAEIIRALQAVKEAGIDEIEFYYVEPKNYTKHRPIADGVLSPREFELTGNNKFASLQGFAEEYRTDQQAHHVYFLGYEASRLQQAFEQRGEYDNARYSRFFVIGVPAFSPGWETNVLANHAQILKRLGLTGNAIKYCSASSIREGYQLLWELYDAVAAESNVFWVSPLGTKPHTVAAALFLLETKGGPSNSSLFYDHPVRTEKRSEDVARSHLVVVKGLQSF